ncbi:MAG: GAF domain-containing sensor histidine kinase [Patescibacteria group bacterium]
MSKVNETLYEHSAELAVRNKTFSLMGKLYEISILALNPKELVQKITNTIRSGLEFELVGVLIFDQAKDSLSPLAFSLSERLDKAQTVNRVFLDAFDIPNVSSENFFGKVVENKTMGYTEKITDIWNAVFSGEDLKKIQQDAHIQSSLVYPLIAENHIIAVLVIGLNRRYSELIQYEKESIHSFVNIIAISLENALLSEQLKITNKQLGISNGKLQELDKQKTEFVSFASHQLRSPLTAMKGYASLILEGDYGPIADDLKKAAQIIFDSTKTLASVVDDYLNVSRIELGQMKYDFSTFDLKDLIQSVVDELKPNVEKAGLQLGFDFKPGVDYGIKADKEKIKQVIGNIIDNSIKYTPKGRIDIGLEISNGKIRLSVKDTGIGISKDVIPKLFSKFSRATTANKTNMRGTGLGLFIAKEIVTAHKGKIWVNSEGDGEGSVFIVEIPTD